MPAYIWLALAAGVTLIIVLVILERRPARPSSLANQRAEALLRQLLPAEEYRALETNGYLEVPSQLTAGRVYRIRRRGPVEVHESGGFRHLLCAQPVEPLPRADMVLVHKVLLESDEHHYIRTANVIRLYPR